MTKRIYFRLFTQSANTKIGPFVACTYSPRWTCPRCCPFRKTENGVQNGCYADSIRCAAVWNTVETSAKRVCLAGLAAAVRELPPGYLLRHNVAGDMARAGSSSIDGTLLKKLTAIFSHVRAWTYTHCTATPSALRKMSAACSAGFTVNQSCERVSDCDTAIEAGVPAVLAVESFETMPRRTPAGRKIVPCPAEINENKSCSNCSARGPLCRMRDRSFVIAFEAHGTARARARAAIRAANAQ